MPYADPDARRAYAKAWAEKNRERLRAYNALRRTGTRSKYRFPMARVCAWCDKEWTLESRPTTRGPLPTFCSRECKKDGTNHAYRSRYYGATYGLTVEAVEEMRVAQDDKCAACGEAFGLQRQDQTRDFHVDHCHATGRIRGLLCIGCNTAAGRIEARGEVVSRYLARVSLDLREMCAH